MRPRGVSKLVASASRCLVVIGGGIILAAAGGCSEPRSSPVDVPSPAEIAEGKDLYGAHGCNACHGRDGRGDGPIARSLPTPPRDLSRADEFRTPREKDAIADVIARGFGPEGEAMPAYRHLDMTTRRRLAAYVLSIAGVPPAAPSSRSSGR